jgi:Uma2 family endonuclease
MATATLPDATVEPLVLEDVSWETYERLLQECQRQPGLRLTYDDGRLQIMTVSLGHEGYAYLLGRFIDVLTEELNIPINSGRTVTCKRKRLRKGLEPDNCYWIAHEEAMRGKQDYDPATDPPPDLAIEVEVSRSAIDRMAIYAALRVPEIWRFNGQELSVLLLTRTGKYASRKRSHSFPFLPMHQLAEFLARRGQVDETTLVRSFRSWVRAQIRKGWKS